MADESIYTLFRLFYEHVTCVNHLKISLVMIHSYILVISVKFLTNLKLYTKVKKYLLQVYIFQRSEKYLNRRSFTIL